MIRETYFVNVVYVQEFIGHSVNGNEFMMAPPAVTCKHVIQPHVDAQKKTKSMSGLIKEFQIFRMFTHNFKCKYVFSRLVLGWST